MTKNHKKVIIFQTDKTMTWNLFTPKEAEKLTNLKKRKLSI